MCVLNLFFYKCTNWWAGNLKGLVNVGTLSLLSEPRFCISNHNMVGEQGLSTSLPGEGNLTSHGWLGGQGSTGKQSTDNRGTQEHELAKTRHAMNFKKYILFLKSWQQFLQTFKPLRDLVPFTSCMYICINTYLIWGGGNWARSCQMSKLLVREVS